MEGKKIALWWRSSLVRIVSIILSMKMDVGIIVKKAILKGFQHVLITIVSMLKGKSKGSERIMAGYIEKDHFDTRVRSAVGMAWGDFTEDFKDGVLFVLELLKTEDPENVVERSKINDAIAEIKDGYYGNEEKSETDSERADAFNNGLSYALEILKRNIGESE